MALSRLHLPLRTPEDVIPHLGRPAHWKQGRSARSLAEAWFFARGIPADVRMVLDQAPEYRRAELVDAFLERPTDLADGRATPSQTDLLAVLGLRDGLAVLGVEAKVTESFGPVVAEWADGSAGKAARLSSLCGRLRLREADVGTLRYQLLHRTAAAMIEAERYRCSRAIMLVQSFCPEATGFDDYAAFARALGFPAFECGRLTASRKLGDMELRLGWVSSDLPPVHESSRP